jgi:hypothetical protein
VVLYEIVTILVEILRPSLVTAYDKEYCSLGKGTKSSNESGSMSEEVRTIMKRRLGIPSLYNEEEREEI